MLDPRFPTYAPGSRRLVDFVEAGEQVLLLAEIRRTLDGLATSAPALIAKGTLTEEQSRAVMFLWLAIAQDLEAEQQWLAEARTQGDTIAWSVGERIAGRADGIAWADKVAALRNEITRRRETYPADVDKGRLTAGDAKRQLERLEAVHDEYWRQGFTFDGTLEDLRAMAAAITDFDVEQDGPAMVKAVQSGGDSSRVEQPASSREDGGATPPPRSIAGAAAA